MTAVPALTTAAPGTVINGGKFTIPSALGNKTFHTYSDFLLHDVGTGDGIIMAMEEHYGKGMYQIQWKNFSPETIIRPPSVNAPLPCGVCVFNPDAIFRHRGEASDVTGRFRKLSRADQDAIVEFLKSL